MCLCVPFDWQNLSVLLASVAAMSAGECPLCDSPLSQEGLEQQALSLPYFPRSSA